jgi:hypothetical protein
MAAGGGVFYVEEGAGGDVVAVAWVSGCGGVALLCRLIFRWSCVAWLGSAIGIAAAIV